MSRYGSSPERSLDPPEPKTPPSGVMVIYVERPVPVVDAGPDVDGPADWIELAVAVSFDEGSVFSAFLDDEEGEEITLTSDERENAEVEWSEDCADDYAAGREDHDAERGSDR